MCLTPCPAAAQTPTSIGLPAKAAGSNSPGQGTGENPNLVCLEILQEAAVPLTVASVYYMRNHNEFRKCPYRGGGVKLNRLQRGAIQISINSGVKDESRQDLGLD